MKTGPRSFSSLSFHFPDCQLWEIQICLLCKIRILLLTSEELQASLYYFSNIRQKTKLGEALQAASSLLLFNGVLLTKTTCNASSIENANLLREKWYVQWKNKDNLQLDPTLGKVMKQRVGRKLRPKNPDHSV